MSIRKTLSAVALFALMAGCQSTGDDTTASADDRPGQIDFRPNFCCYNCSIDWAALSDPNNNGILNAALGGADLAKLRKFDLQDLDTRLRTLEQGNLIQEADDQYGLAFPAVVGAKRTWLRKEIQRTASQMWPTTQQIVEQLRPHLAGREHMTYHVVWSLVMDGRATWWSLQETLKNRLGTDVSLDGIGWLIFPRHAYSAGTNTYFDNGSGLSIAITWTRTTPSPSAITARLGPYGDQLAQAILHSQPVADSQPKQALAQYGLVDADGALQMTILDAASPAFQEIAFGGVKFALEALKHMDLQNLADKLGASRTETLVIAYHELCYELLERLAAAGAVEIPQIAREPNAPNKQVHRLISFVIVRDSDALQQQFRTRFQELTETQN